MEPRVGPAFFLPNFLEGGLRFLAGGVSAIANEVKVLEVGQYSGVGESVLLQVLDQFGRIVFVFEAAGDEEVARFDFWRRFGCRRGLLLRGRFRGCRRGGLRLGGRLRGLRLFFFFSSGEGQQGDRQRQNPPCFHIHSRLGCC